MSNPDTVSLAHVAKNNLEDFLNNGSTVTHHVLLESLKALPREYIKEVSFHVTFNNYIPKVPAKVMIFLYSEGIKAFKYFEERTLEYFNGEGSLEDLEDGVKTLSCCRGEALKNFSIKVIFTVMQPKVV